MGTLLDTPILTTRTLRRNFDDKIIMLFAVLLSVLILMALLFIDLTATLKSPSSQTNDNTPADSQGLTST